MRVLKDRVYVLTRSVAGASAALWVIEKDVTGMFMPRRLFANMYPQEKKPASANGWALTVLLSATRGDIAVVTCEASFFFVCFISTLRCVRVSPKVGSEIVSAWPHLTSDGLLAVLCNGNFFTYNLDDLENPKHRFSIAALTNRAVPYTHTDYMCQNPDGTFTVIGWHDTIEVIVTNSVGSVLRHHSLEDFPPGALPHSIYRQVLCVRGGTFVMGAPDKGLAVWMNVRTGRRAKVVQLIDPAILVHTHNSQRSLTVLLVGTRHSRRLRSRHR